MVVRTRCALRQGRGAAGSGMDEEHGWLGASALQRIVALTAVVVAAAGIVAGAWWVRKVAWNNAYQVNNPAISPATIDNEGDGRQGEFFPSST